MTVEIKFCGLTRLEDASFAASLGASYVGAIFAGGPRKVTPERAAELFTAAGSAARHVGVFGAERPDEVARLRGLDAESFVPKGMLHAYQTSERGPQAAPEVVA